MDDSTQQGAEAHNGPSIVAGLSDQQLRDVFGDDVIDRHTHTERAGGPMIEPSAMTALDRAVMYDDELTPADLEEIGLEPEELSDEPAGFDDGTAVLEDLVDRFPELQTERGAAELLGHVTITAESIGQPELVHEPEFWALVQQAVTGRTASPQRQAEMQLQDAIETEKYISDRAIDEAFGAGKPRLPF